MKAKKEEVVVGDVLKLQAESIPAEAVQQGLRIDPLTAKRAFNAGIAIVSENQVELKRLFPGANLEEIFALPVLCDRFAVANSNAISSRRIKPPSAARPLIATALLWRRKLMSVAQTLVANGKVDAVAVARIRAGRGPLDGVTDVVALVALLKPFPDVIEVTCDASALSQASSAATAALSALGSEAAPDTAAIDLRDRYATLIARGHDRLRVAVAVLRSYREAAEVVGVLTKHAPRKLKVVPPAPL